MHKTLPRYALAYGSFLAIPFFSSSFTLDPALLPRFLLWSIMTLCLLAMLLTNKDNNESATRDYGISRRFIYKVLLFHLIVSLLSLSKAVNWGEGIFGSMKIALSYSFFIVVVVILSRQRTATLVLSRVAICGSLLLSICGIVYWHGTANDFIFLQQIKRIVVNKNIHASALFLLMPYALHGSVVFKNRWKLLAIASLTLTFCSIALLASRTVWLALLLAGFPVIIISMANRQNWNKSHRELINLLKFITGIIMSVILIAAFLWVSKTGPEGWSNTQTLSFRLALWKSSVEMIKDEPILGVGSGQWRINLPKYYVLQVKDGNRKEESEEVRVQRPHNDLLLVVAENGVLGGVAYLLFFMVLLFYVHKIVAVASDKEKVHALAMTYGVSGYFIIAMFSFPGERVVHNLFLMLMAAGIVTAYHRHYPLPISRAGRQQFKSLNICLVSISLLCLAVGTVRFLAETNLKEALAARDRGEWQQVISKTDRASSFLYSLDPFSTPLHWYRGMANYNLGRVADALVDFRKAAKQHPFHVHVLNNIGTCLAVTGDYQGAIRYFKKALALEPQFSLAKTNLRAIMSKSGEEQQR